MDRTDSNSKKVYLLACAIFYLYRFQRMGNDTASWTICAKYRWPLCKKASMYSCPEKSTKLDPNTCAHQMRSTHGGLFRSMQIMALPSVWADKIVTNGHGNVPVMCSGLYKGKKKSQLKYGRKFQTRSCILGAEILACAEFERHH